MDKLTSFEMPKDRTEKLRYAKYKKIIDTINHNLKNGCANIKEACAEGGFSYSYYFRAKDYFSNAGKTKARDIVRRNKNNKKITQLQAMSEKMNPYKKKNAVDDDILNSTKGHDVQSITEKIRNTEMYSERDVLSKFERDEKHMKRQSTSKKPPEKVNPNDGFTSHQDGGMRKASNKRYDKK
jgi:hypothetical protein